MQIQWRGFLLLSLGFLLGIVTSAVRAEPRDQESPLFRLGVITEKPDRPADTFRRYGPLHAYLRAALGNRNIRVDNLNVVLSVPEMANRFAQAAVDAVIEGVIPILIIEQRSSALDPALLVWRKGQRQYQSVFFVRHDSAVTTLDALRGHTIAFESPRSTSAFFVPLATLRERGLAVTRTDDTQAPADAVRYVFADAELNQAYWVQRGKVDAGAFNDGDWERVPEVVRKDLRIIERTPPLPRWLLAFRSDLDPRIRQAVTEILLDMHKHPAGQEALRDAERIAKIELLQGPDSAALDYWRQRFKYLDSAL
jgi:phosphonate transport system substrate-binding protein